MVEPYCAKKPTDGAVWVFIGHNRMWARNPAELAQYGSSVQNAHVIDASAAIWLIPTIGPVP